MAWLKVAFVVPRDSADPVSLSLQQTGAIATSLFNAGSEEIVEASLGTATLWSQVRVEALLKVGMSLHPLHRLLGEHGAEDVRVSFVQDAEWENAWRKHTTPKKFGRLHVLPRESSTKVDGPFVRLDPGLAFGTGEHATTAMCLSWLESIDLDGRRVLDFGCGSGILGLAAAKFGASQITAIDNDEQAIEVTQQNAKFNEVNLTLGNTIPSSKKFDVVVANILLNTLVEHAIDLTNSIAEDGVIGLTGLLTAQKESIVEAFPSICFGRPVQHDEWILMIGRKTPDEI